MCILATPIACTYGFQSKIRTERIWICKVKGLVKHSSDSKYVGKGDLPCEKGSL